MDSEDLIGGRYERGEPDTSPTPAWMLEDTSRWPTPFRLESPSFIGGDGIVVVVDAEGEWLEIPTTGHQMPAMFQALVNRPGLPLCQLLIEITPTGPVCLQLTLVGEPLTAAGIRVKLRELVKEATGLVGSRVGPPDESGQSTIVFNPEEFLAALDTATSRPERGKRLSEEWLERVAEVYRWALSQGLPATDTVAEAFPISRSTAGRWVMEARRRGLLGPAVRGRAGEQKRRTKKEE